jgi:hypothetical protein
MSQPHSNYFSVLEILTTHLNSSESQATGREAMVASFYHEGYEDPLLMLIRRRGVDAGLVIKVHIAILRFPTCVGFWSTQDFNN